MSRQRDPLADTPGKFRDAPKFRCAAQLLAGLGLAPLHGYSQSPVSSAASAFQKCGNFSLGARMHRLLLTLVVATLIAVPAPTSAGTKEDTFLAGLVGMWSGTGKLIGSESGQLTCNSTFRAVGNGVNFRVKCDIAEFGAQNFSGTLAYNEDEGRYESKSTGGEITIGTRTGNAVVFTMKMRGIAPGTSVMKLSATKIIVDTKVKRPGSSGSEIRSYIELRKS